MIEEYVSDDNLDFGFIEILSRASMTIPSINLTNQVSTAFAILYFTVAVILKSSLTDGITTEHVLFHNVNLSQSFICKQHKEKGQKFPNCAIINIYFKYKKSEALTLLWKIM